MVRATIHEAKFHHNEKAWRMLGEVLAAYLKHYQAGTVILPIPLSSQRQRERGYNQVTEVAKRAEKTLPYLALRTDILFRRQNTAPQTSLAKAERLSNVAGAFGARHQDHLSGRHFIILDDVATTGATLKAARASLAPHRPASITLLSLAH